MSSKTVSPKSAGSPGWFWNAFRRAVRSRCVDEAVLSGSRSWTKAVTAAAVEVCTSLGGDVAVGTETGVTWTMPEGVTRKGRLDVSATRPGAPRLLVAFETELAPVGYLGRRHEKTWREEFEKLCGVPAELRVLSSYFLHGTGGTFEAFLRGELESMRVNFDRAEPGAWLFVFGSEDSRKDPDQPWLAFTLREDFLLEPLPLGEPTLRPRRVARGLDPASE